MESTSEYHVALAMWQYCPPVLFAFGTFGNTMTVLIIRRMKMKRGSAMPVYLTALAVSDTCVLYTGLLRGWLFHTFDVDLRTLHSAVCKMHTWLVYSFLNLSAWVLTFMTMERTVSVWRPHRVSLLCSRGKAIVIVVILIATSLSVNGHLLFLVDVVETNNLTKRVCYTRDPDYVHFMESVWAWIDLTLASLLPFSLVLLGNSLIVWKVSLSVRAARHLGSNRPQDVSQRQKKTSSMTLMLMSLSVIFFVTTSPICIYNIIHPYVTESLEGDPLGTARLLLAWAMVNILMYTNSTINFYLYCLSGTLFRRELKKCLWCHTGPGLSPSKNVEVATTFNQSQHHVDGAGTPSPLPHVQIPVYSGACLFQGPSQRHLGVSDKKRNEHKHTNQLTLLSVQKYTDTCDTSCSEF